MKKENKHIINDLRSLIGIYLSEETAKDFIKALEEGISANANESIAISELDKSQVEYELPRGTDHRLLVDKIVTDCEKLLPAGKYYSLLLDLSQLMLFEGESAFSQELAEGLLQKVSSNDEFLSIRAETLLMISKIHWAQAQWDDCNYYISEAMKIFKSLKSKTGSAKCENMLGTLYGEKGEFDEARKHLENALSYLKEEDDLLSHALILTNLGIINTIQGDYDMAIWNYKNSIEKFETLNDSHRLSRVHHNIGMLYTQMGKYDAALDEFNKCITLSLDKGYLSNCAVAYIGKAFIYTKLKNPALANAYTDKAMEIAYKINDTLSIADIYKIKGMIQNDLENFELSEELFENSIRLNKDIENKLNEAESFNEMGKLLQKNEREEAKTYIDAAEDYFKEIIN